MYWTTGLNATPYSSLTVNGVPQFQAANPAGGVPNGTELTYPFFNDLQGENINIVLSAGIAPAENTPTQVLQGLKRIFGGNVTALASAQTLTLDQLGLIELGGAAAYSTTLPTPVSAVTPPISVWNNSAYTQTLVTPAGTFAGPGGSGTANLTLAPGQYATMRADGTNYVVASIATQKEYYTTTQTGTISPASNTTYNVYGVVVTFPAYSRTGAFRVLARLTAGGNSLAANGGQNFINTLNDGSSLKDGASWLVAFTSAGQLWGIADTFLTTKTYAPGQVVTFTQQLTTGAGVYNATLIGCVMELSIVEA